MHVTTKRHFMNLPLKIVKVLFWTSFIFCLLLVAITFLFHQCYLQYGWKCTALVCEATKMEKILIFMSFSHQCTQTTQLLWIETCSDLLKRMPDDKDMHFFSFRFLILVSQILNSTYYFISSSLSTMLWVDPGHTVLWPMINPVKGGLLSGQGYRID